MEKEIITIYELMGLMKDGKAPKKINYNGDIYIFAGEDYSKNDDRETWLITEYDYFLSTFLNDTVEIVPEENDEWEDIKELEQIISSKAIYDNYEDITKDIHNIVETIDNLVISFNQLIKNQKYLKERLESKDD